MSRVELAEHVQRLQAEADQINERIERLRELRGDEDEQLRRLRGAHRRLMALHDQGRRLYVVAEDR